MSASACECWVATILAGLPLSVATILAGVRTAAVINVGTATLGGFIGAGGYGRPILRGIDKFDVPPHARRLHPNRRARPGDRSHVGMIERRAFLRR